MIGKHATQGKVGGAYFGGLVRSGKVSLGLRLAINVLFVKNWGGVVVINKGEIYPAGLRRGNMLWGAGWVRLG